MRVPLLGRIFERTSPPVQSPYRHSGQNFFGLTQGGFHNPATGAGIPGLDRTEGAFWTPTWYWSKQALQTLYVQSWAAAHFVDIPIDDMFVRWRHFKGERGAADPQRMTEMEDRYDVRDRLSRAMKAARLYGTGLLVIMARDAPLSAPMMPEQVRPDDVSHLLVFDRYSASVRERDMDLMSPTYGEPIYYDIYPQAGPPFMAHSSRVIRFDAIRPFGADGFTVYDRDWGVSAIVPVIIALVQDQSGASAAGHLMQIASMDVVRTAGFREAVAGQQEIDEPSPESIGERMNRLKSVYRTIFMDREDEFERQAVSFSGLPDMLDRMARRVAAAAQIPATRFWGQSPVGLNATGESDMVNYAQTVLAMQDNLLRKPLSTLDMILARSAGLREPPEYEWLPLTDTSEADKANTLKARVETLAAAITAGIIDEDEARRALDGDEFLGDLPGMAPGPPMMEMDVGDADTTETSQP